MKSDFPQWLLKMEPYLVQIERRNRFYQMFRERRLRQRSGVKRWLAGLGIDGVPGVATLLGAFGIFAILIALVGFFFANSVQVLVLLPFTCCFWIIVPFGIWPWIKLRQSRRVIKTSTLPLYIDSIFSMDGVYLLPATDLWLAGAKGSEIIEAIYADVRERTWRLWFGGSVLLNAALFVGIVFQLNTSPPERILIGGSLAFLLVRMTKFMQAISVWRTMGKAITQRFQYWKGEMTIRSQVARSISDASGAAAYLLFVVLAIAYTASMLSDQFPATFTELAVSTLRPTAIIITIVFVLLAMCAEFVSKTMAEGVAFAMEASMREANQLYHDFMAYRVFEDAPIPVRRMKPSGRIALQ